jgi:prephenate dehydrogenase
MKFEKIGIIGLGLIGGSLAKTIRRVNPNIEIVACDTNEDTLTKALDDGVISFGSVEIGAYFEDCRYLFLCTYVQGNLELLQKIAPYLKDTCILTDMGSVKSDIHKTMKDLGLSHYFIGGHPMAGSEKSGYEYSTPYMFENAYYIITNEEVSNQQVRDFESFLISLGCLTLVTSPKNHDFMTATVSHLPHILAACLVNLVEELDDSDQNMKSIAAGGFKDITRIASSNPQMWQEICLSNQEQIQIVAETFSDSLKKIQATIHASNQEDIFGFFQNAKDYRDSLPISQSGDIAKVYEVYCDLVDEVGGIAAIATLLAKKEISIKNIGIIHNREFEEGVLRIELYEGHTRNEAVENLRKSGYNVYER